MNKWIGNIASISGKLGKVGGLRLNREEALRYLGHTDQEIDEELAGRFEKLCLAVERDTSPSSIFASYLIDGVGQDGITFDGCTLNLPGTSIAEHLEGAVGATLLACTLGVAFTRHLQMLELKSPAEALLFNAAGSAYIEAYANAIEAQIVARAHDIGLHTSHRFSPGYGDLPLDVQSTFLSVLDTPRKIGLSVTDANLLVPEKSITAVVGLFESAVNVPNVRSACDVCQLQGACSLRERGVTCHD